MVLELQKNAQQAIEERFAAIEKSVEYINKSIDGGINPSLKNIAETSNKSGNKIIALEKEVEYLQDAIDEIRNDNKNPLLD